MKTSIAAAALACLVAAGALASSQGQTVSSSLGVYVFPAQDQSPAQQSKDETACYNWAVQNTKIDPAQVQKQKEQAQAQAQSAGQGSAARGAVRGATRGALIGEIADDKGGEGAAIGAVVGASRGRRQGEAARQQSTAQAQEQAARQMDTFRKAFGACMEGKKYSVKF